MTVAEHARKIVEKLYAGLSSEDFANLRAMYVDGNVVVHRGRSIEVEVRSLCDRASRIVEPHEMAVILDPNAFYIAALREAFEGASTVVGE